MTWNLLTKKFLRSALLFTPSFLSIPWVTAANLARLSFFFVAPPLPLRFGGVDRHLLRLAMPQNPRNAHRSYVDPAEIQMSK